MKPTTILAHTALLCVVALTVTSGTLEELEPIALEVAASRLGLSLEEVEALSAAVGEYSLTGVSVFEYKVWGESLGEMVGVALDGEGNETEIAELDLAEREAFEAAYGRFEPEVLERLSQMGPDETLPVVVWVSEPEEQEAPQRPETDQEMAPEELDAILDDVADQREAFILELVGPIAERATGLDMSLEGDEYAPVLSGDLKAVELEIVNGWPEVERIYLQHHIEPYLHTARVAIDAETLDQKGITGFYKLTNTRIKAAVVEPKGLIATNNPYLGRVFQDGGTGCTTASDHATQIVGTLVSSHSKYRGIAPDLDVLSTGACPDTDGSMQAAFNRAIRWGAKIVNLSWGRDLGSGLDGIDRWFDSKAASLWRTITAAAGNNATLNRRVSSPGRGFNIITVGASGDNNTGFPWSDDYMWKHSSYLDPSSRHNDREKPEVVAPGHLVSSTETAWPWAGAAMPGTSISSPIVAGAASLLIAGKTKLQIWPEAVKAILMASAIHNIEGDAELSDKDGAGMIDAYEGHSVARGEDWWGIGRGEGGWDAGHHSCSSQPGPRTLGTIHLEAGKIARVALVWSQNTSYYWYGDQPSADLDLHIVSPGGGRTFHSTSWDDNFEILLLNPGYTGTYTLKASTYRCDASPPFFAWAWWQNGD